MKKITNIFIILISLTFELHADNLELLDVQKIPPNISAIFSDYLDVANGKKPDDLSQFVQLKNVNNVTIIETKNRILIPEGYPRKYRMQRTPEDTLETKMIYVLKDLFFIQVIDKVSNNIRFDSPVILWKINKDSVSFFDESKSMENAINLISMNQLSRR